MGGAAGGYLGDHLASGLGSLAVRGSFTAERQHSLSGGPVLESKFADDAAESRRLDVADRGGGLTQEQQEGVEPGAAAGGEVGQCTDTWTKVAVTPSTIHENKP